ncbi:MAG: pyridoxal phosphate-dependent aminotransferase [Candidatus Omnitrophica bacterium]|nr:pyridoxal phosphate-dependent aminotransferase [Candidatus Omnitrophota bacterium]
MVISKRAALISPSPTLAITAKAKKMQAEGINVIGFGAGEPDFDTPVNIKEYAKKAIDKGFTKYTPTSGTKEIKDAVCHKFKEDNGLDYSPEEVLVSCGAKHSLFNAMLALCDDGDEVILQSPFWVSYTEMIKLSGAKPVILKTGRASEFKLDAAELEKAVTPRTKLVIINSPSNPTGTVYSEQELKKLSEIIVRKKIYCVSDEIYEKIIYDGRRHVSMASFGKEIKDLTITVNGVSKAYSMTGWRIGYAAGPKAIIQAMSNLQDHSTSNPTSISQVASVEALKGDQTDLEIMVKEFKKRRDYMIGKVNSIKGLSALVPGGAFYAWVDINGLIGKKVENTPISGSMALTEVLLNKAHVAVVPGGVFGDDGYIRLSYATSMENITEGLSRIEKFIEKL